jgi:hypothetical protein
MPVRLMSDERGCGRDADGNARDVTPGAVIARDQPAAIDQVVEGKAATLP